MKKMYSMIRARQLYRRTFEVEDSYLKDAIFDEARRLILERLNSTDVIVKKEKHPMWGHIRIAVTIAKTPEKIYSGYKPGIGDHKKWYLMWKRNQNVFPEKRVNKWLKSYGWQIELREFESFGLEGFEVRLISECFTSDALDVESYIKENGNNLPYYMYD